jgi:hypothetical protein
VSSSAIVTLAVDNRIRVRIKRENMTGTFSEQSGVAHDYMVLHIKAKNR